MIIRRSLGIPNLATAPFNSIASELDGGAIRTLGRETLYCCSCEALASSLLILLRVNAALLAPSLLLWIGYTLLLQPTALFKKADETKQSF